MTEITEHHHKEHHARLLRGLSLFDSTMIISGSMIGSGIFIVSAEMARTLQNPLLLLGIWAAVAIVTVMAALSYGELAAAMPRAGGQYVYLREAYSPLFGFLYGWTLFTVIQTGSIAAISVAFAKFLGAFFPWVGQDTVLFTLSLGFFDVVINTQTVVAVSVILFLTWVNTQGLKAGAIVQNVFTVCKIGALIVLILVGLFLGKADNTASFAQPIDWNIDLLGLFLVSMVGGLFSADSWNNITFTAGEVKNPKRNLPLSLALGTSIVLILYFLANVSYLQVLTLDQIAHAPNDLVGSYTFQVLFGNWGTKAISAAILVSTFGCINGLVLSGARVYYAMAKDRLFFKRAAEVEPKHHTPRFALWIQAFWACLLAMSGNYNQLLDYVIFAALLFYVLTMAGIFVLRKRQPNLERPYKAFGYPILTGLYILIALSIMTALVIYKPTYSLRGLMIVLIGIPIYFIWQAFHRRKAKAEE
jgi:APA family basic amino acid/polyamine antiporter